VPLELIKRIKGHFEHATVNDIIFELTLTLTLALALALTLTLALALTR
jgi:hypothetical protein